MSNKTRKPIDKEDPALTQSEPTQTAESTLPVPSVSSSAKKTSYFDIILWLIGIAAISVIMYVGVNGIVIKEWLSHILTTLSAVSGIHWAEKKVNDRRAQAALDSLGDKVANDVLRKIDTDINKQTSTLEKTLDTLGNKMVKTVADKLDEDIDTQTSRLVNMSASLDAMARSQAVRIYATRAEASPDIARDLLEPRNSSIRIIGISLNDFIRGHQDTLRSAWIDLEKLIEAPTNSRSLTIQILLIDSDCMGSRLRAEGERRESGVPGSLEEDVKVAATRIFELRQKVEQQKNKDSTSMGTVSIDARLYRLAPVMFLCHTDTICYVEQYHFWSAKANNTPIPVIAYRKPEEFDESKALYDIHSQMIKHFDWVWENASVSLDDFLYRHVIGTDRGICESSVSSIYTNKSKARERMLWLLDMPKNTVRIQGVSLSSFFRRGSDLFKSLAELIETSRVDVDVLVLDPDCEQAKFRSYRERLFDAKDLDFETYKNSGQHEQSALYRDTSETLRNIKSLVEDIRTNKPNWVCRLRVRKYSTAPSCFLLLVDDVVLVEQYLYGKIVPEGGVAAGIMLGSDMPSYEFCNTTSSLYQADPLRQPYGLLRDHVRFVFDTAKEEDLGI